MALVLRRKCSLTLAHSSSASVAFNGAYSLRNHINFGTEPASLGLNINLTIVPGRNIIFPPSWDSGAFFYGCPIRIHQLHFVCRTSVAA